MTPISAVIVAGGTSSRMQGVDKLMCEVGGIPVIVRTVGAFDRLPEVSEVIVVTAEDNFGRIRQLCEKHGVSAKLKITAGGAARRQSAENGFKASSCPLIAIHDGARPFVTADIIQRTAAAAEKSGAAIAAVPVKDTIKLVRNGEIEQTPDRSLLYAAQTPQIFSREAYEKAMLCGGNATDDASMAEAAGIKVTVCEGSYENIKITTPEDLLTAEMLAEKYGLTEI